MLQEACDECRQLTREQLEMVVTGQLHALCHRDQLTQKNKAQNSVVRYILQYAEDHAILLPGRIPGYKRDG